MLNLRYPFGQLRPATQADLLAPWGGGKPGERFRCYFCGAAFKHGDLWRAVFANCTKTKDGTHGLGNFLVGKCCDADDPALLARWQDAHEELDRRFWWAKGGRQ